MLNNKMRIYFPVALLACLLGAMLFFTQCKSKQKKDKIPNALEDKSIDVSLLTKRSGKDLLDNLYEDLEEKSEALQELENEMEQLNKMKADSITIFSRYNNKINTYYTAAYLHVQALQDSVLRDKMKKIIDSSVQAYGNLVAKDTMLIKGLDSSQVSLQDMFSILKIVKTLPLIHGYQKGYLPADSIYQNILNAYNSTIQKIDSMSRQP